MTARGAKGRRWLVERLSELGWWMSYTGPMDDEKQAQRFADGYRAALPSSQFRVREVPHE